jgi:uncharacterized iron-regulated membrane protein
MKPLLAKLHKYVALTVGVLVAMMGLSGSLLVLKDSLEERWYPERRVTRAADAPVLWERVLWTARATVPVADSYVINRPDDPLRAFNVNVEDPEGRRMYVDPYTGRLIENNAEDELALDWVAQLHTHLLGGDTGKYFVAAIGAVLVFLAVTGLILWWPRKWGNAFRIRWDAARLGLSYDLHRSTGALLATFFLVNALTGITLAFSAPAARFVGALAGNPPYVAPQLPRHPAAAVRLPLDDVVRAATEALPEGRVKRVIVPSKPAPVLVRMQVEGDHHPNGLNRVYVDPYDGKVLGVRRLAGASPGNTMFDWLYPLHIGRLFGTAHTWFQVFVGVVPAFLLVTGLIVWQASRSARRRRQAQAGAKAAGAAAISK